MLVESCGQVFLSQAGFVCAEMLYVSKNSVQPLKVRPPFAFRMYRWVPLLFVTTNMEMLDLCGGSQNDVTHISYMMYYMLVFKGESASYGPGHGAQLLGVQHPTVAALGGHSDVMDSPAEVLPGNGWPCFLVVLFVFHLRIRCFWRSRYII